MNTLVRRNLLWLTMMILVGFAISATNAVDEKFRDPWENVNIKGSGKWFTLAQLKKVSDAYLHERDPKYDLRQFEVTANVFTDNQTTIVKFQYFQNFGLPVLYVTLNGSGAVAAYTNRIASERLDMTTPIPPQK